MEHEYSTVHAPNIFIFFPGAGGPQVPPLNPIDIKIEEMLGDIVETVDGINGTWSLDLDSRKVK